MSFDTLANLKIEIIQWSHRSDLDLKIESFIKLTESDIYKSTRTHEQLEIRGSETTSTASVTTKLFALPDQYLSMRSVRLDVASGNDRLSYMAPDSLRRRTGTGKPCAFTIGSQIEFDVTPDQAYTVEVNYYKKPLPLTSIAPSNDILANHPEIYLNGALYFLFAYADDEAQAQKYLQRYADAINGANEADDNGRYGPAPFARIEGSTP